MRSNKYSIYPPFTHQLTPSFILFIATAGGASLALTKQSFKLGSNGDYFCNVAVKWTLLTIQTFATFSFVFPGEQYRIGIVAVHSGTWSVTCMLPEILDTYNTF